MSDPNDSSFEMHEEDLSPEEVERLVSGVSERPDLAELATLLADVRALPNRVGTPAVSAALSEFVGVDLTPTPEPIVLTDVDDTPVSAAAGSHEAQPVRRNSMIGQLAAFLGTMGGKVVVGTTVAAASVGGAHASGVVDVPFLPDQEPAEIETVDLPEDPDALAFVEDDITEKDDHEKEDQENEKEESEKKEVDEGDTAVKTDDEVAEKKPYLEDDFDDYPEHKVDDKEEVVDEVKEEPKEEPKKEEPKKEEPKKEEPKEKEKTEAEKAKQELISALEEEVHLAKDAVRAAATALINPLEEERDALLADLEEAHHALALEWEGVIESLLADLEGTEDEAERAAIEELIDAAEASWAEARVAAELEVDPRLEEINDLFHVIETERDAEIDRLLEEFFAAVEEIENS